jgi:hypothetical protein
VNEEVDEAIEQWEDTVEMEVRPAEPKGRLQSLLREYHE